MSSNNNIKSSNRPHRPRLANGANSLNVHTFKETVNGVGVKTTGRTKQSSSSLNKFSEYLNSNSNANANLGLNTLLRINEGRDVPGMSTTAQSSDIKNVFTLHSPKRVRPTTIQNNNNLTTHGNWKYYRPMTAPQNSSIRSLSGNKSSVKGVQSASPSTQTTTTTSGESSSLKIGSKDELHFSSEGYQTGKIFSARPSSVLEERKTLILHELNNNKDEPIKSESTLEMQQPYILSELVSCLKTRKIKTPEPNGNSISPRQNVTFSPETVNIERENKPKKLRCPKNNRKPKFAHPCCGHFLPPSLECCTFLGPDGISVENPYTKFTCVWGNPSTSRNSVETDTKWKIRFKRFRKILADLSESHQEYNFTAEDKKPKLLVKEIIPRYVMALDIALMDSDLMHTEQLIATIGSTVRILQVTLHDIFFETNGIPKELPPVTSDDCGFLSELGPVVFALNRIAFEHNRYDVGFLSLEPLLVKLQLELLSLTICPIRSLMFRCLVAVLPHTSKRALELLSQIRDRENPNYYIKWVNNSVCHRDYMAILKDFGFCDDNGATHKLPPPRNKNGNLADAIQAMRPLTADPLVRKSRS